MTKSKPSKPAIDPLRLFEHADRFHYSELHLRANNDTTHMHTIAGPSMVLAAFAAELYLKCLVYLESGKRTYGHNLKALYRELSPASRKRIRELWDKHIPTKLGMFAHFKTLTGFDVPHDLEWALSTGARGFEQLRYIYEEEDPKGFFILGDFPAMLRRIIVEMKPEWGPQFRDHLKLSTETMP